MKSSSIGAIARRIAVICLSLLTLQMLPGLPQADASGNSGAQLGAYVDWGSPWGRESNLKAFESWLGRSGLLALDYMPGGNWADLVAAANWLPGYWWEANHSRNVVWSIPLTVDGTSLAQVAAGSADAAFQTMAVQIARAQPGAIIRLGWEANGDWFAWSGANDEQSDYIAAFQHVVAIFRAASPQFLIDWCVDYGSDSVPASSLYPGDAFVDIIGMDIYDKNPLSKTDPLSAWNQYLASPFGLRWHRQFATQHRKPMSYPEWGIGQEGDNPFFVNHMAAWIKNNNVVYSSYWNTNAAYPGMLSNGQYPKSATAFKKANP